MNRRDAVTALSGAAVFAFANNALAQKAAPMSNTKPVPPGSVPSVLGPNKALIDATEACLRACLDCEQLCVEVLSKGDTSMAECMGTVRQTIVLCEATAQLARIGSVHAKAVAAACAKACRDCEKACRKHEGHHAECKACAESCAKCASECDKA